MNIKGIIAIAALAAGMTTVGACSGGADELKPGQTFKACTSADERNCVNLDGGTPAADLAQFEVRTESQTHLVYRCEPALAALPDEKLCLGIKEFDFDMQDGEVTADVVYEVRPNDFKLPEPTPGETAEIEGGTH